ncbi:MAG TPA: DUF4136 domain-containing protein [Stenotrophomonas sp.]|nr:DUF4136 domain-containing protein [Stenotrophomonas sp.]
MKARFLPAAFAALLLAACASSPTVKTDHDPAVDFSQYRTYTWGMKPQAGSPLVQQRIVDGIDARLQARGWRQAPDGQVTLAAHIITSQRQTLDTFYTGTGMGGWGWRGGWGGGMGMGTAQTTVRTYDVGTLVVDMFDTRTQQAIWRGTASGTVPSTPERVNAAVEAGLDKMFTGFPPGSSAAK